METIKSFTYVACFLGVAIAMLDIIRPSEKLKKQVRFVFSLVFIIAIISCILKNPIEFEIPTQEDIENSEEYIEISNTFTECLADNFKTNIENNLHQKLEVNSILVSEVNLDIDITEDDEISIVCANVITQESTEDIESKIKNIIENEIGKTEVEIFYAKE